MLIRVSFLALFVYFCQCVTTEVAISDIVPSSTGSIWQPLAKYFGAGQFTYSLSDTSGARVQVDPSSGVLFGRPPQAVVVLTVKATDDQGNIKSGRARILPTAPDNDGPAPTTPFVPPTPPVTTRLQAPQSSPLDRFPQSLSQPQQPPQSQQQPPPQQQQMPPQQQQMPPQFQQPPQPPQPQQSKVQSNHQQYPQPPPQVSVPAPQQALIGPQPMIGPQPQPQAPQPKNNPQPQLNNKALAQAPTTAAISNPPQSVSDNAQPAPGQQISSVAAVSASANVGVTYRLEAAQFFKSTLPLTYSMTGAPRGSQLTISTKTGTIFGTPGDADAAASPLNLVIGGTDQYGRFALFTLVLIVQRAPPDLNTLTIAESQPYFYDIRKFFSNPGGLSFTANGFPAGSGLTLQQAGILFGTPNSADTQAVPYLLRVVASDSQSVMIRLTMGPNSAFSSISQSKAIPTLNLVQGSFFSANFASFLTGNLTGALYGIVGLPQNTGLVIDSLTGTFFGTPNGADSSALQPLTPSLVVVASDNSSIAIEFLVSVRAVHNAPFALPIPPQTIQKGASFRFDLSAYFSSDDTLSYAIYTLPAGSGLSLNSQTGLLTGLITAADAAVPQQLSAGVGYRTLSVCASTPFNSTCSNMMLMVNSTSTDTTPLIVAIPDTSIYQGIFFSLDLSRFVRSANSPAFSVQGLPRGSGMAVDSSTGVFSGTPTNADVQAVQPLNLTVYVSDGRSRGQRTWMVQVRYPNRKPITQPIPLLNATVGSLFQFDASKSFSDPDQDILLYSLTDLPTGSGFSIDSSSGVISGIPTTDDANTKQPQRITIQATDPGGLSAQTLLYVNIRRSNSPPVQRGLLPDQVWTQGTPVQFNVSSYFSDPDQDVLQYSISGLPRDTGITLSTFTGQLMGTPSMGDLNAIQPLRVLVTVVDGQGGRIVTDFFVTIKRGNRAPIALPIPAAYVTIGKYFSFSAAVFFADEDGDVLTYSIEGLPSGTGMLFNTTTAELSGTPNAVDMATSQPMELLIWGSDGKDRGRGRMFLTVRPANRPPVVDVIPSGTLTQGTFFSMGFSDYFHDPDNEALTYTMEGLPLGSGLSLDSKSGQFSGRPNDIDVTSSPVTLFVTGTDGRNGTVRTSFQLRTQRINSVPVVTLITNAQGVEGTPFWKDLGMSFTDPDGDRLIFQINGLPDGSGLTLNPNTGYIAGTPTAADVTPQGPRALRVLANDGRGGVTQAQFLLTVRPKSVTPFSQTIPPQKGAEGVPFNFPTAGFFSNAPRLKFSVSGLPPGSGLTMDPAGVLAGMPSVADRVASPLSIIIIAQEPMGGQTTAPLFLVIAQPNRPPVASLIPPATVRVGDPIELALATYFQDPDGQPLSFGIQGLGPRSGLSLNQMTGKFSGTALNDDFMMPQPLRLQITGTDSNGLFAVTQFIVTVLPFNHPPAVNSNGIQISARVGQPVFLNAGQMFADADDDTLMFALNGLPNTTGFQIDEDTGLITGSLKMDDCDLATKGGPLAINVSATDGIATTVLIINVMGCPFRVVLPPATAQIFAAFTYDGAQGFAGANVGSLTYDLAGEARNWLSIRAETGYLTGTPTQAQCTRGDLPTSINCTVIGTSGPTTLFATLQIQIKCVVPPVKATPIPPATAVGGQPFFLDVSPRFDYVGPSLKYQITGLPGGTGLTLNPSGAITGVPNQADCGMTQPMALRVSAQDGSGNTAGGRFYLTVKCSSMANIPPANVPIVAAPTTTASSSSSSSRGKATDKVSYGQILYLDLGSKLASQMQNPIFSLAALPVGTGFSINPRTGVVSGSPTTVDCQQASSSDGPTLFRILAQDSTGEQAGMSLFVDVDCSAAPSGNGMSGDNRRSASTTTSVPIVAGTIPLQVIVGGVASRVDLRSYFISNQSLTYSISGMEASNMTASQYGLIRGTPSCVQSGPLVVSVSVTGPSGDATSSNFTLVVLCPVSASATLPPVSIAIPDVEIQAGSLFYFDASPFFAEPAGSDLNFACSCDVSPCAAQISSTGIVTGQTNATVVLNVTATSSSGLSASSRLRLNVRPMPNATTRGISSIPPMFAQAQQGRRFSLSLKNISSSSKILCYTLQGLTRGTGLTFDHAEGRLWGIPSLVDAIAMQPLSLTFMAQSSRETVMGVLTLNISRPAVPSDASCEELGWDTLRGKNNSICGSSLVSQGDCSGTVPFATASRMCGSWGARLCSAKELGEDEAIGTGCGLDTKPVWSSTECSGGFQQVAGSSAAIANKCVLRTQQDQAGVRCCAVSRLTSKNTLPVAADISMLECYPNAPCIFDLSGSFSDRDGDALTYIVSGLPVGSGFQMGLTTGVLAGVPTQADFSIAGFGNISAVLSVTVDDGRGGWVVAPIQLLLHRLQENSRPVPTMESQSFVVTKGEVVAFSIASKIGNAMFSQVGLPLGSGLSLDRTTGIISGTPNRLDQTLGLLQVFVTAADNQGSSESTLCFIRVREDEAQPKGRLDVLPLSPETAYVGTRYQLECAENFPTKNGTGWRFAVDGLPSTSGLTMTSATGTLSGIPNRIDLANSPYVLSIAKITADQRFATKLLLTVLPMPNVTELPSNQSLTLNKRLVANVTVGQNVLIDLFGLVSNPFNTTLSFQGLGAMAQSGLRVLSSGILTGVPNGFDSNQPQPLVIGIMITDTKARSISTIVNVFVTSRSVDIMRPELAYRAVVQMSNMAPRSQTIPTLTVSVGKWTEFKLQGFFTDPDNDPLTLIQAGLPRTSGLNFENGVLFGTPNQVDLRSSPLRLHVTASDGSGGTTTQILNIIVNDAATNTVPNRAPVATELQPQFATQSKLVLIDTSKVFSDPDVKYGDSLRYTLDGLPMGSGLHIVSSSGVIMGTLSPADFAEVQPALLTVTATDNGGLSAKVTFQLFMGRLNDPPLAIPFSDVTIGTDSQVQLDLSKNFYDPAGKSLVFTQTGLPSRSGLTLSQAGMLSGRAFAVDLEAQPLQLAISTSNSHGVVTLTQVLNVQRSSVGFNRRPITIGTIRTERVKEDAYVEVPVWPYFVDPDGDVLRFEASGFPEGTGLKLINGILSGKLSKVDGNARLQPRVFNVTAIDPNGALVMGSFALRVQTANTPPVSTSIPVQEVQVGRKAYIDVSMNFLDRDADDVITFSLMNVPKGTDFTIEAPTGIISGTASEADFDSAQSQPDGALTLLVVATDSLGASCSSPLSLRVKSRSSVSCEKLGWSIRGHMGGVCSESQKDGKCPPVLTQSSAASHCDAMGARLCTTLELDSKVGLGAKCGIDKTRVWSSNTCKLPKGKGYATEFGNGQDDSVCLGRAEKTKVLCCADAQDVPQASPQRTQPNIHIGPILLGNIPSVSGIVGNSFVLEVWPFFRKADGTSLRYSISGLPTGTGLTMLADIGILTGVPTNADLGSTRSLVVIADDNEGGKIRANFALDIQPDAPSLSGPQTIELSATAGKSFSYLLANKFDASSKTYRMSGTSAQSGLRLDPNGLLSGVPTTSDTAASPLTLVVTAVTPSQSTKQVIVILSVSAGSLIQVDPYIPALLFFLGIPIASTPFLPYFHSSSNSTITIYGSGLPLGSGLSIQQGNIIGRPNGADLAASRGPEGPGMLIVLLASDSAGAVANATVRVEISPPDQTNTDVQPPSYFKPLDVGPVSDSTAISDRTCSQLGWALNFDYSRSVCIEARGSCSSSFTYDRAVKQCAAKGARLCLQSELADGVGIGGPCGDSRVWTNTRCGGANSTWVLTRAGGDVQAATEYPERCTDVTETFPAQCCADAVRSVPKLASSVRSFASSDETQSKWANPEVIVEGIYFD